MTRADRVKPGPQALAGLLFLASAAFVYWRNTQVGVLVDLGYVLNVATRIALGDVPYRDFPLVNAPGEFLIQGALIKLFGPHYIIQIVYASLAGGAATVLAFVIARRILAGVGRRSDGLAAIVALPLVPLGIYGILPNPFYDPDSCLAVLGALALLLSARETQSRPRLVGSGMLATVALFIGQNIGGAFLFAFVGVLVVEAWARPSSRRELGWIGLGVGAALGVEVALLQLIVGIDAFLRWTWTFALSGRGVALERISDFADPVVLWTVGVLAVVAIASPRVSRTARLLLSAAAVFVLAASLIPSIVVGPPFMFPPVVMASVVLCVVRTAREGPTFGLLLPLVLVATTLGTIESQGLLGSSYGIYPLLSLALACLARDIALLVPRPARVAPYSAAVIALLLTGLGTVYTLQNGRLMFIDVNAPGPIASSTFPSLSGLSARGPYLLDLDAMLFWIRANVPPEEGFVFLPGEDPGYFALGRKPALPSVYFFDVASPYTPAELARIADDVGLRWVFVKDRLQLVSEPPLHQAIVAALTVRATLVDRVGPYRIYRRAP